MKKHIFFLAVYSCAQVITSYAQSWSVKGNTGTDPNLNFVGTTDNKPLAFKTSNSIRMRINSNGNIGIGTTTPVKKLDVNGNINIGKGFSLFMENRRILKIDSANQGTFLGNRVAPNNNGFANTASGYGALFLNTTGNHNTAHGANTLANNTVGKENVANGAYSLYSNTTGKSNTATGFKTLYFNTFGEHNVATGSNALYSNTSGSYNSANGYYALYYNTTGSNNTATGDAALANNTTGSWNTAAGYDALLRNNGSENTAYGVAGLFTNTTGTRNTGIGNGALFFTTASHYNTAIGFNAGGTYNNGWNNVFVGAYADANSANFFNDVAIGQGTICTGSNQARIGNSSTTSIGGYANWTTISDGRVKKNMKENVPGLAFINKLKPVTYNLDLDAADKLIQPGAGNDKEVRPDDLAGRARPDDLVGRARPDDLVGRARPDDLVGRRKTIVPSQSEINARNAKQQILYTGFVAQDVEKAAKEMNYNFSGVDAAKNDKDLYGLRYAEFVVPLVKAVQELSEQNRELKMEIQEMKTLIPEENLNRLSSRSSKNVILSNTSLEQNVPNPFSQSTTISYSLPQSRNIGTTAQLVITDNSGKTIKQVNVNIPGAGKGTLEIDASTLAPGTYNYSLVVDGKRISSKQMMLVK